MEAARFQQGKLWQNVYDQKPDILFEILLIVLWFGEYQALTMAGCINQISLWGSSLNVINSCLADQVFMDNTFSK